MKKKLILVLISLLIISNTFVFAANTQSQTVDLGDNKKVVCEKYYGDVTSEMYAVVKYVTENGTAWEYITASSPLAVIDSISNCYVNDDTVYIVVDNNVLQAIDLESGKMLWQTEGAGTTDMAFDIYGNIYNIGFFGPNLAVFNKDGNVMYYDDNQNYGRVYDLKLTDTTVSYTCEYDYDPVTNSDKEDVVKIVDITQFEPVTVKVNGTDVEFDAEPFIKNGRTLVPLRAIFEALGAAVDWEDSTQTVTSQRGDIAISLAIGSNVMYVNQQEKIIDEPAQLLGSRTFVPVRAISEAFGCQVNWDEATKTVYITD